MAQMKSCAGEAIGSYSFFECCAFSLHFLTKAAFDVLLSHLLHLGYEVTPRLMCLLHSVPKNLSPQATGIHVRGRMKNNQSAGGIPSIIVLGKQLTLFQFLCNSQL